MHFSSRSYRVLLALAVLCPGPAGQAQEVFVRVPVELGGTATRSTLPFSEPFLLVGAAPGQLRLVDARYVIFTEDPPDRERCKSLLGQEKSDTVGRVNPWSYDPQVKADSFAVLVTKGLRANRRYGFCMRTQSVLDSTTLTQFQSRAYTILDSTYLALNSGNEPPDHFPQDQLPTLRLALARALPKSSVDSVDIKGTIFDTTATGTKPTEENLVFTTDVLRWQRDRYNAALSLTDGRAETRNRLLALHSNRALQRIAATITGRNRVPGMDSLTLEHVAETARLLAFPDTALFFAAAGGEAVLAPAAMVSPQPTAPLKVTDPVEVAVRAARIDSTFRRVSELRDFVTALEASPVLQSKTEVAKGQAEALRRSIDGVRTTIRQVREFAATWAQADARRHALLVEAARSLKIVARDNVPVLATTISSFETRARQYITADVGVAYAPGIGEVVPYFGANFYPGALNKRVPLSVAKPPELDRWSFTVGVTASSLARKDVRNDLFSSFSLLLGAGRRMTDPLRLTGGVVVYRSLDVNPLVDHTSIAMSPFLSLSLDFDARSALGRLGDTLFH